MDTPASFPQFRKIPIELRLKIWSLAVYNGQRPIVALKAQGLAYMDNYTRTFTRIYLPLNACSESRSESIRLHKKDQMEHSGQEVVTFDCEAHPELFDPTRDAALVNWHNSQTFKDSLVVYQHSIQHLIIDELRMYSSAAYSMGPHYLFMFLASLPSLERVIILELRGQKKSVAKKYDHQPRDKRPYAPLKNKGRLELIEMLKEGVRNTKAWKHDWKVRKYPSSLHTFLEFQNLADIWLRILPRARVLTSHGFWISMLTLHLDS